MRIRQRDIYQAIIDRETRQRAERRESVMASFKPIQQTRAEQDVMKRVAETRKIKSLMK